MKFSICIPSYNAEKTIQRAIESVLAQTNSECELIVIDDRSSDNTVSIAKQYEASNVKVIVNDENLGVGRNWNKAYKVAKGDWVLLLGHDDYLADRCLEKVAQIIDSGPVEYAIIAITGYFSQIKFENKRKYCGAVTGMRMFKEFLPVLHIVPPSEFFVNRQAAERVNWLDEKFSYSPEMMLQWKIYQAGGAYFGIDDILVFRSKEPFSITSKKPVVRIAKDKLRFFSKARKYYSVPVLVNYLARIVFDSLKIKFDK